MRIFLLIMLFVNIAVGACLAQTYSCRDEQGQIHFADSPQGLPTECWEKAQLHKSGPGDDVQYVPASPRSKGSGPDFTQSLQEVEQELSQKQKQEQRYLKVRERAEELVASYRQARTDKRRARRSWSNSSRQIIKEADENIEKARTGKQNLLDELARLGVSAKKKATIEDILEEIEEEQ